MPVLHGWFVVLVLLSLLASSSLLPAAALVMSLSPTRFLVVGGNGRVGGSTAKHLHILSEAEGKGPVELILGGRSRTTFEESKRRILQQLAARKELQQQPQPTISFQELNLDGDDPAVLAAAVAECDPACVVHTAGPFQQRTRPVLLEAALKLKLPYVDVCDEPPLVGASKDLDAAAREAGTVAVVAGGIWPGASALMAAEAVAELRRLEGKSDVDGEEESDRSYEATPCANERVDLSFFTAGTGNAGATIVSATFLLLCQPALTLLRGREVEEPPWTDAKDVDFGGTVGVKTVRLLDNPDVFTLSRGGGAAAGHPAAFAPIPTLRSRFATAPGVWNQLFGALIALVPPQLLGDRDLAQAASVFSLPIIRAVDQFVGATNAMRVDAWGGQGDPLSSSSSSSSSSSTFPAPSTHVRFSVTHDDLEQCVGLATAAFALEVLQPSSSSSSSSSGVIAPGVYFPSELPALSRRAILERVKKDAVLWEFEVETSSTREGEGRRRASVS